MTTMNRLATINVTIDFALPFECYTYADWADMDTVALSDLFSALSKKMDNMVATKQEESLYWEISCFYDQEFYNRTIDDFREYCTHKDEPDFDWSFYSDWHKDLFGFRPHY